MPNSQPFSLQKTNAQRTEIWPIDVKRVTLMLGDEGMEMINELLPIYFEDAHNQMHVLQEAVERKDADQLFDAAHSLRGSSINMGMVQMADLCQIVEMMGKSNNLANASRQISAIKQELHQMQRVLT